MAQAGKCWDGERERQRLQWPQRKWDNHRGDECPASPRSSMVTRQELRTVRVTDVPGDPAVGTRGCSSLGIWQGWLQDISSAFHKRTATGEHLQHRGLPIPYLVPAISPEKPIGPDIEDPVRPWVLQDEAVTLSLEHVGATQLAPLRSLGPLHRHPEGVHCGDRAAQGRAGAHRRCPAWPQ